MCYGLCVCMHMLMHVYICGDLPISALSNWHWCCECACLCLWEDVCEITCLIHIPFLKLSGTLCCIHKQALSFPSDWHCHSGLCQGVYVVICPIPFLLTLVLWWFVWECLWSDTVALTPWFCAAWDGGFVFPLLPVWQIIWAECVTCSWMCNMLSQTIWAEQPSGRGLLESRGSLARCKTCFLPVVCLWVSPCSCPRGRKVALAYCAFASVGLSSVDRFSSVQCIACSAVCICVAGVMKGAFRFMLVNAELPVSLKVSVESKVCESMKVKCAGCVKVWGFG